MPKLFGQVVKKDSGELIFNVDSSRGDARELELVGQLALPQRSVIVGFDHDTQLDTVTLPVELAHRLSRSTQPCD